MVLPVMVATAAIGASEAVAMAAKEARTTAREDSLPYRKHETLDQPVEVGVDGPVSD